MGVQIVASPAVEPVSLSELKLYLRIAHDAEDPLLADQIGAARGLVEACCGRALIRRRILETPPPSAWAGPELLRLRSSPVTEIQAVTEAAEPETVLTPSLYRLEADDLDATVRFLAPVTRDLRLELTAGFSTEPAGVPAALRQAVIVAAAAAYLARDGAIGLPEQAKALLAPFKRVGM